MTIKNYGLGRTGWFLLVGALVLLASFYVDRLNTVGFRAIVLCLTVGMILFYCVYFPSVKIDESGVTLYTIKGELLIPWNEIRVVGCIKVRGSDMVYISSVSKIDLMAMMKECCEAYGLKSNARYLIREEKYYRFSISGGKAIQIREEMYSRFSFLSGEAVLRPESRNAKPLLLIDFALNEKRRNRILAALKQYSRRYCLKHDMESADVVVI